ncbi:MAG: phenylalanine--tRNA ligase subunit beta [Gammaproteobacteria bacterium HGW-Gammaproteobacteria-2]|jgi:phenylalanyl-tRNA synthetase beta chain|nr:MAG: phenylalanine--tRNA ligase subunit beta [Gammaproteobacteria bacterium HGW-Gammaproteobacteria-2]
MKFPESWLRQHVAHNATAEGLAERLTAIGLEVEEMQRLGEGLDGVVVARIVACSPHPQADRLQVCSVDAGGSAPVQIVCGAPNARPGLVAPLAVVGASLPGGIAIKAAKLRGVESQGMLCSARELGLDNDASGLLELPADAPVGQSLLDYLGLPDTSYEIKLTPNRADCFGIRGIAYDVAAATGAEVLPFVVEPLVAAIEDGVAVQLDAGDACPRYCGRVIRGIDPDVVTPLWMRERLRRSGVRPISFLVDVTQYVMLELGQPMHAFDRDLLKGPVGVRLARPGETLKLLDERTVALDDGFVVITDAQRPVALAGVMGGWDTRVTEATCNVFLESAHFAPDAIIGRARRLGMHTDASHRFERGVDPELPRQALEYATRLILDIAGGKPGAVTEASVVDALHVARPVSLRRARLQRVLGITVSDNEIERILRALGMVVEATADGWSVLPPSRRFDIAIEEDLIEEVVRIHGYEAVPTTLPSGSFPLLVPSETRVADGELRRQLLARDYAEAVCFSFLDAQTLAHWQLDHGAVTLANPLSEELAVMRTALLPGLVQTLARNRDRQQGRVRLFELGRVFHADGAGETRRIAAVACGTAHAEQWGVAERELGFYDIKGDLESLLALAGPLNVQWTGTDLPWLHPGRSASVKRGEQVLGWIGALHPALLRALDLDSEVWVFEMDLDAIAQRELARARPLSRFPSVRRDLAVVLAETTPWAAVEASVRGSLGERLNALLLFDQYQGPGLESGTKSLAMGLILHDVSRTLTDHDADSAVADVVAALGRDCGARIRG